ncbi:MAG: chromosome condensation regulator RCC1 [Gemmatimonadetes bacterium]|nr:MAG: chromosome condensation regulator RCC1 [Gemmatimonadota bacterium]
MNTRTCAILAGLGLLGCSSGTGPNGAISLSVGATPSGLTAGDSITVGVQALTSNNVTLRLIVVRITGVLNVIDSVSLHAVGETLFVRSYLVPLQTPPGTVTVKVTARGGSVVDSGEVTVFVLPRAYTSISTGGYHTCALTPDSTAYCWGANGAWQLGTGDTVSRGEPRPVAGGHRFVALSAGGFHTCALTVTGTAYCWGGVPADSIPTPVGGGITFALLAAGGTNHQCGLTAAGAAYCWGYNGLGQLGDGDTTSSATPVPVSDGLTFTTLSTGGAHSCGLTAADAAYCWGFNNSGQLGDSSTTNRLSPVAVHGAVTFAALATGGLHSCGITSTGAVYCWGANGAYQLGDGTQTRHEVPVPVQTTVVFTGLGGAVGSHTCGLTASGVGYCWGDDLSGQIGDGSTFTVAPTPRAIAGGLTFAAVNGGSQHSCAVSSAHVAYCWGYNGNGQVGIGPLTGTMPTPVPVIGQIP